MLYVTRNFRAEHSAQHPLQRTQARSEQATGSKRMCVLTQPIQVCLRRAHTQTHTHSHKTGCITQATYEPFGPTSCSPLVKKRRERGGSPSKRTKKTCARLHMYATSHTCLCARTHGRYEQYAYIASMGSDMHAGHTHAHTQSDHTTLRPIEFSPSAHPNRCTSSENAYVCSTHCHSPTAAS